MDSRGFGCVEVERQLIVNDKMLHLNYNNKQDQSLNGHDGGHVKPEEAGELKQRVAAAQKQIDDLKDKHDNIAAQLSDLNHTAATIQATIKTLMWVVAISLPVGVAAIGGVLSYFAH